MSDAAHNPDDYCYRHPDRLSFVLCERCGRTICLECQNHIDGRVLCPDDANARVTQITEAREAHAKRQKRTRRSRLRFTMPAALDGHPVGTYAILVTVLLVFLIDIIAQGLLMPHLWLLPSNYAALYGAPDVLHQPWSVLTSMISTSGVLGLILGGYSVYVLGRFIEPQIGTRNLLTVYVAGGLGASGFSLLLDGAVTSWFGASMGVALTAVLIIRRMRANAVLLYVSLGISILLSFFLGGWQATIGGALAGAGTGLFFYYEDDKRRQMIARTGTIVLILGLIVLGFVRAVVIGG